jgi:hypothetical protein
MTTTAGTTMSTTTSTPAWLLERIAQGEMAPERRAEIRARLAREGRQLDDELAALERSSREILVAFPVDVTAAAIRHRLAAYGADDWLARPWLPLGPVLLVGTLGILFLLSPAGGLLQGTTFDDVPHPDRRGQPGYGPKAPDGSGPTLLVYRRRPGAATPARWEHLPDGAPAARGDLLQLAYVAARPGLRGVLLSIDGAGGITRHLPEDGASAAAELRSGTVIPLSFAFQLDDAPAFERFVLVTAPASFDVHEVMEAARALSAEEGARARSLPLVLGPGFHQASVVLDKSSRGAP